MNYRHGYHAGNFADVVKHVALVAILAHLKKKDPAFSVIDSHAGRGTYDLAGAEASKTNEATNGIGRLADLTGRMPEALSTYLSLAREEVNNALRKEGIAFDINNVTPQNLEELIEQLRELTVDVDNENTKVRVFCE